MGCLSLILQEKSGWCACCMMVRDFPNLPTIQMGFTSLRLPFIFQAFHPTHSIEKGPGNGRTNGKETSDVTFRMEKEKYPWR